MMGRFIRPPSERKKMDKYFKKANGRLIKYDPANHDLDSLKDRFEECEADGSKMKPEQKKKKDK